MSQLLKSNLCRVSRKVCSVVLPASYAPVVGKISMQQGLEHLVRALENGHGMRTKANCNSMFEGKPEWGL